MVVVAITGVSGYLGSELASRLDVDPEVERIVGIDLVQPAATPPKLKFVRRSVTEPFADIFESEKVTHAVHLAFAIDPTHDRRAERATNVTGTERFLAACEKAKVEVVLVASSAAVYGAHPDHPPVFFEGSSLRGNPGHAYAEDKLEQERLCREFAKRNPKACLQLVRPVIVLGPRVSNYLSRSFLRPYLWGVRGHDPELQFVHEEDATHAIFKLLKSKKLGVFNIGADGTLKLSQAARIAGARFLPLPLWLLRLVIRVAWVLRLRRVAEAPAAFLPLLMYPVVVSGMKLKREVMFRYKFTSQEAFVDFIDARAATMSVATQTPPPARARAGPTEP